MRKMIYSVAKLGIHKEIIFTRLSVRTPLGMGSIGCGVIGITGFCGLTRGIDAVDIGLPGMVGTDKIKVLKLISFDISVI